MDQPLKEPQADKGVQPEQEADAQSLAAPVEQPQPASQTPPSTAAGQQVEAQPDSRTTDSRAASSPATSQAKSSSKTLFLIIGVVIFLVACCLSALTCGTGTFLVARHETSQPAAASTEVSIAVQPIITIFVTVEALPTYSPYPTYTFYPTYTLNATTEIPPTDTPVLTNTPAPTSTAISAEPSGTQGPTTQPTSGQPTDLPDEIAAEVGQVIQLPAQTIVLNNYVFQGELLTANFTIANTGDQPLQMNPQDYFEAWNFSGDELTLDETNCTPFLSGSIDPGNSLNGMLCWQGPFGDGIEIYYDIPETSIVWTVTP